MKDSLKETLLPLYRANCPYLLLLSFMLKYNLTEATAVAATAAASIVESTATTVESASVPIFSAHSAQVEFVFASAPVS